MIRITIDSKIRTETIQIRDQVLQADPLSYSPIFCTLRGAPEPDGTPGPIVAQTPFRGTLTLEAI